MRTHHLYYPLIGQHVLITHTQTKNPNGEQVFGKLVEVIENQGRYTIAVSDGHKMKFIDTGNVTECRTMKE